MCNLYNHRVARWELADYRQAVDDAQNDVLVEKEYTSPGRPGYVLRRAEGNNVLSTMTWGFPPPQGGRNPVVNVRNYSSPFWRSALKNPERRCLVPATEFQEWSVEPIP